MADEGNDGSVSVKILDNGLKASIIVTPEKEGGNPPTLEIAHAALKKEGVTVGIDVDVLERVFREKQFNQEIAVASGIPAVDGKDAQIKMYFNTSFDVTPKEDDKGNVDFKDISLIKSVTKGQKLAELIPPVPGKEGKTVTGEQILPAAGKMVQLPRGRNTEVSSDNPNILVASVHGNAKLQGAAINIEEIFVVEGDVDFKTGNIDYIGPVLVKGNVKAGFEVRSENDVEINGLVEDAQVHADGNVIIKNGFLGKNNGLIEAKGEVVLKFCENQNIRAKGNIIIGEAVLHSNLQSEGVIEVKGRKGSIIGGTIRATKGLIAKELGNYQEIKTDITVGVDDELIQKIKEADEEVAKNDDNLDNVKKAIYSLKKKKMILKKLPKDQEDLLAKLQKLQEELPGRKKKLEEKKEEVVNQMRKYDDVTVDVLSTVYPGTRITIQSYSRTVSEEMHKVRFRLEDKEVKDAPL